jgi:putative phosphoesterase
MTRLAIFSDVHGNLLALEAVQKAIRAAAPDVVMIAGDLVFNGPRPVETLDLVRELEREGALVIQGNTDIAVADFDFTAAFPWFTEGAPESFRIAAQWAHDALGAERLDYLRRLPAERRLRVGDDLVLLCHASPGSQTAGLDPTLDPTVVVERVTRTDARLICCGHTHLPEVRDLGWKVVVNDGSAGYVFDGNPTASWALVDLGPGGTIAAEIKRAEFDVMAVANELTARGLPGDVYRAATVRTGKLVR